MEFAVTAREAGWLHDLPQAPMNWGYEWLTNGPLWSARWEHSGYCPLNIPPPPLSPSWWDLAGLWSHNSKTTTSNLLRSLLSLSTCYRLLRARWSAQKWQPAHLCSQPSLAPIRWRPVCASASQPCIGGQLAVSRQPCMCWGLTEDVMTSPLTTFSGGLWFVKCWAFMQPTDPVTSTHQERGVVIWFGVAF